MFEFSVQRVFDSWLFTSFDFEQIKRFGCIGYVEVPKLVLKFAEQRHMYIF